jgi:hypothetical protein
MKVRIGVSEWYPVFRLSDDSYDVEVEVPEDTVKRWKRIDEEFDVMQKEMDKMSRPTEQDEIAELRARAEGGEEGGG